MQVSLIDIQIRKLFRLPYPETFFVFDVNFVNFHSFFVDFFTILCIQKSIHEALQKQKIVYENLLLWVYGILWYISENLEIYHFSSLVLWKSSVWNSMQFSSLMIFYSKCVFCFDLLRSHYILAFYVWLIQNEFS